MGKIIGILGAGILLGAGGLLVYQNVALNSYSSPSMDSPVITLPNLPEPYYRVLFENDVVRIVDHQLAIGEVEPEHTHPPMVVYFVSGATVMITESNGSKSEVSVPTGAFLGDETLRWWTHSLENTGDTPLHSILVEFKQDPSARGHVK